MDEPFQSRQNRLLDLLSPEDFKLLEPHLQPVTLEYRMPLYEPDRPIPYVYFPLSGVGSLVNTMTDGSAAEVGTIGNEGMIGVPIVLEDTVTTTSVYVQVPGAGLRMPAGQFREALNQSYSLRRIMLHYTHVLFNQVTQSAACNTFHHLEARCCRWLLMTHDRVQSEEFLLTQEFLGMMLGVRRSSVNLAAGDLKRKKLIRYSRGKVTVLDRPGLLKRACECYAINRREFDRLLGQSPGLS